MFTVYIWQSEKSQRYYIGHMHEIGARLAQHNLGRVHATKKDIPWRVIYTEKYSDRSTAYRREQAIKRFKGGVQFHAMLAGTLRKR